jgi:hypothetical protein
LGERDLIEAVKRPSQLIVFALEWLSDIVELVESKKQKKKHTSRESADCREG